MAAVKSEDSKQVRNPAFQFLTDFRGSLRLEAVGTQGSIGLAKSSINSVENPLKKKKKRRPSSQGPNPMLQNCDQELDRGSWGTKSDGPNLDKG